MNTTIQDNDTQDHILEGHPRTVDEFIRDVITEYALEGASAETIREKARDVIGWEIRRHYKRAGFYGDREFWEPYDICRALEYHYRKLRAELMKQ